MKTNIKVPFLFVCLVLITGISISCKKEDKNRRLNAVRIFADNVLEKGIDRWSGKNTPLLADGINVITNEPLEYVYDGSTGAMGEGGPPNKWIIHNLANQQNLFRTFVALSNLTGDPKYREAAEKSIRFHFDSLRDESGLFHWGGHEFIDLRTLKPIGHAWRQNLHSHELKDVYPYYDLMWEVDKEKTAEFIRAFWNAHVIDWSRLDFNRHGVYNKKMGQLWNSEYHQPEPFFEGDGLTFLNTGSDLIYAGSILYSLSGDEGALTWSKRLAEQYVRARHPKTDLGAYQFSKPIRKKQPPDGPLTGLLTYSDYGDRAENQFGKDFPGIALEGWALFDGAGIYTTPALMQLELAEKLGDKGKEFIGWTLSGLYAYAKYAYNCADNTFRPMWADGTDLTGYAFPRTGYYGPEGHVLKPSKADELFLFTYQRAVRFSMHTKCWRYFLDRDTSIVRSIWRGLGLGDPGTQHSRDINWKTDNSSPYVIFALIERHKVTGDKGTLRLAKKVADNLLARSFHKGFFVSDEKSTIAEFDAIEPLALLALEAALRGEPEKVPVFSGGMNHLDLKTE
ncbi:MAG: pectate lyase [Bacteroidia bacterium]|nr:pectate lyase [Bacteroidia bacterium]